MTKKLAFIWLVIILVAIRSVHAADVVELRCESRIDPLGIDTLKPQLSWIINSDRRGEIQTGYQVLVASTPELLNTGHGDLWDSGRVGSSSTAQIEYAGLNLSSLTQCFWKVRVWDKDRKPSAWSQPSQWSMGMLQPTDWTARWISDAILADPANRPLTPIHCYRSDLSTHADAMKWIVIDLGSSRPIDGLDIIPARPQNQNSDFRTAMFPVRFKVETADERDFRNTHLVVDNTGKDYPNPRSSSCRFQFKPVTARYVRLTVTRLCLWDGEDYGIALGGLAVFDGLKSIAVGAAVECSDSIEAENWSKHFLTDGKPSVKLADSPTLNAGMSDVHKKVTVSRVPMLRRGFNLSGEIRRATLCVTARGFYEMRINGQRVSDDLLAPGFTDYGARLQYQTHDVTALLHAGPNAMGAMLGYGWYAGHMNLSDVRCIYGYFPQLLAQLNVDLEDGTRIVIGTDSQWHSTLDSPVRWSDLLDGEGYDCNREISGWDVPGFDDHTWKPAWSQPRDQVPLVWGRCQPIKAIREFQPTSVKEVKPGVYVFDFGQEITGWCRLNTNGPAGTHVRLRHAEMINSNGDIDPTSLMGTLQGEDYILDGKGERSLEPHFTYHGFRYVELSGLPGEVKPDTLIAINLRTAVESTGQFECSNQLYNHIQKAAEWTQANLLFDVPNGCAARSERVAWMGDVRPCVPSLLLNFDTSALLNKYVCDIRDAQLPDGRFTDIAPHAHLTGTTVCVGSPGWADAGVSLPWELYVNTGNKRVLSEHFEAARRWVDVIHAANPDLLWHNLRGQNWGDWLSSGVETPRVLGSTAFFAHSTDLVSRMALALGRKEDAAKYQSLYQEIRRTFVKNYVTPEGIIGELAARDVTTVLRSQIKNGKLELEVHNEILGGDPAPLKVKTLHVMVRNETKSEQHVFAEGSKVQLGSEKSPVEIVSATYGATAADRQDTQGSYALALWFGLLDKPLRTLAAKRLDELVIQNKFHPATGFWSSSELLLALSASGYNTDAAEVLNQRDELSWGAMANYNTTFWECFDADKRKLSLCHWTHSAVSGWLWGNVAGLVPDEQNPGFQSFLICPRPNKQVTWCKASYKSIRGVIVSDWKLEGNHFTLAVTIPANTTATVCLPTRDANSVTEGGHSAASVDGVKLVRLDNGQAMYQVDSGKYHFACESESDNQ